MKKTALISFIHRMCHLSPLSKKQIIVNYIIAKSKEGTNFFTSLEAVANDKARKFPVLY